MGRAQKKREPRSRRIGPTSCKPAVKTASYKLWGTELDKSGENPQKGTMPKTKESTEDTESIKDATKNVEASGEVLDGDNNSDNFEDGVSENGDFGDSKNSGGSLESEDSRDSDSESDRARACQVWAKPSNMAKLTEVKRSLGRTWDETLEVLIALAAEAGLLDEQASKACGSLPSGEEESYEGLGIGRPFGAACKELQALREELQKASIVAEDLIEALDDHAEALSTEGEEE